jgi:hypothetical protein
VRKSWRTDLGQTKGRQDVAEARDVWTKLGELSGVVGMMDAVYRANPEQYEQIAEGWTERLDEIISFADRQIQEITDFGEAYDEG